jgi:hypothetical protein
MSKCANDRCTEQVIGKGYFNEYNPKEVYCSVDCMMEDNIDDDFEEEADYEDQTDDSDFEEG